MKSPGGKIEWSCPDCFSGRIWGHFKKHGQKSGECLDCGTWWPWRQRFKRSAAGNI